MPEVLTPVIPQNITVHLGAPDASAQNVTVDFVDYIKNAEYVFTSSFHGMAMSIVFEKQFFYDLDRNAKNNNSRLETLAEILSLENREAGKIETDSGIDFIDYSVVHDILYESRKISEFFLKEIFN